MESYTTLGLGMLEAVVETKTTNWNSFAHLKAKKKSPTFISVVSVSAWEQCQNGIYQPG